MKIQNLERELSEKNLIIQNLESEMKRNTTEPQVSNSIVSSKDVNIEVVKPPRQVKDLHTQIIEGFYYKIKTDPKVPS